MTTNTAHRARRLEHYKNREARAWTRGFAIGFTVAFILVVAWFAPALASARTPMPPNYRAWLRIGMCEQPKPGISWHDVDTDAERIRAINWRGGLPNYPGGLGLTRLNWTTFRPPSAKHIALMSDASIQQQLWAAERLWRWAERTYPGYGFTAWECSRVIGWTTSDPKDALR